MPDRPEEGIQPERASNNSREQQDDPTRRLEVNYFLRIEDALAFLDYHLKRTTGAARSSLWWAIPGFVLLLGALALVYILMDWEKAGWGDILFLAFSALVLGGYVFWRPLLRATLRRNLRRDRTLSLPHRVLLTPEAIETSVGSVTVRTLWEGVVKVVVTQMHVFIYLTPSQAIVIPGRVFESELAFEDFFTTARHYWRESGI